MVALGPLRVNVLEEYASALADLRAPCIWVLSDRPTSGNKIYSGARVSSCAFLDPADGTMCLHSPPSQGFSLRSD